MQLYLPFDDAPLQSVPDGTPGLRQMLARHYSARHYRDGRRSSRIVGPGEYLILVCRDGTALLAYRRSRYPIAGICGVYMSVFRRESACPYRTSDLLRLAEPMVWQRWPNEVQLFTLVDPRRVSSPVPGYCYRRAGWRRVGVTQRGLLVFTRRKMSTRR